MPYIEVNLAQQQLALRDDNDALLARYTISTAANGAGEQMHSECTPLGLHMIRAKIGAGCQPGTVFVGRRPTGERYSPVLKQEHPDRDWILTRIMWLSGLEPGRNRLGNVDTMRRYIYIHGAPDEDIMGVPSSHGCIKMRDADLIDLFGRVDTGTRVIIKQDV
ncbi:MAG TPA: L,D-transpeptidase [Acidiferrobacteraceae bacterium]|nr:L,D-transpeptidase [Acidiferrobacteraceae bacterium]